MASPKGAVSPCRKVTTGNWQTSALICRHKRLAAPPPVAEVVAEAARVVEAAAVPEVVAEAETAAVAVPEVVAEAETAAVAEVAPAAKAAPDADETPAEPAE